LYLLEKSRFGVSERALRYIARSIDGGD